jgi:hypothetical protein
MVQDTTPNTATQGVVIAFQNIDGTGGGSDALDFFEMEF